MAKLVILGGGEHARSVAWAASAWELAGFLDSHPIDHTVDVTGAPHLGTDDLIAELATTHEFVLGVGTIANSAPRRALVERARGAGARFATVIHASARIAPSARVEAGAVVLAGAIVGPGTRIGAHAVVNTGAIVEHDNDIGEFAQVAPGAVTGGGVRIGDDAFVGLGARIRDHVSIGARAVVGMGAVVVGNIPEDASVLGIPARGGRGA